MTDGRWAKVLKVHPEAHAVDLVFLDTGARVPMVPVLAADVSTNTGRVGLALPTPPADDYGVKQTKDRDVYAAVQYFGGLPAVVGFKVPEVGQMTFKDPERRVDRHPSDVYSSIDKDGNAELFHPSGTYIRIGTASAHEDLTGLDFDKKWKIAKNTGKAVHIHVELHNGGATKFTLDVDPSGNVTWHNVGTLSIVSDGNVTVQAPQVTIDTPTAHFTGNVNVDGTVTANTEVIANGKHLTTHTHGGVTTGGGVTGAPV